MYKRNYHTVILYILKILTFIGKCGSLLFYNVGNKEFKKILLVYPLNKEETKCYFIIMVTYPMSNRHVSLRGVSRSGLR